MGIWGDDFGELPEGVRSVLSGGSDLYKFIYIYIYDMNISIYVRLPPFFPPNV